MLQERTSKQRTKSKPLCALPWRPRANATLEKEHGVLRKYCHLFKMTKLSLNVYVKIVLNFGEQFENQGTL